MIYFLKENERFYCRNQISEDQTIESSIPDLYNRKKYGNLYFDELYMMMFNSMIFISAMFLFDNVRFRASFGEEHCIQ